MLSRVIKSGTGSALLALGLLSSAENSAVAQMTSGPGLSSGTGQGTGAGGFSGVVRNPSGSISGTGPPPSSTFVGSPLPGPRPNRPLAGFGPDVDVRFPNDPFIIPFEVLEQPSSTDASVPSQITSEILKNARMIVSPEERSLALQRIAQGATSRGQFFLAHKTLEEAITAASNVKEPLVRDQRLIALVTSLTKLADALLFAGRQKAAIIDLTLPDSKPAEPAPADSKAVQPPLPQEPKPARRLPLQGSRNLQRRLFPRSPSPRRRFKGRLPGRRRGRPAKACAPGWPPPATGFRRQRFPRPPWSCPTRSTRMC